MADRSVNRPTPMLRIVEHVSGVFSYHLALIGTGTPRAMCGNAGWMMQTQIPLSAWGTRSHLREKWCSKCAAILRGEEDGR